jgi:hypothetical protein
MNTSALKGDYDHHKHRYNEISVEEVYEYIPPEVKINNKDIITASKIWIADKIVPTKVKWVAKLFAYIFMIAPSADARRLIQYFMIENVIEEVYYNYQRNQDLYKLVQDYNIILNSSSTVKKRRFDDEAETEGNDMEL